MLDITTLWKGNWVSVVTPTDENFDYEVIHEPDVVFVLPIIMKKGEVVIREEVCPPYMVKDENNFPFWYTVISGKIEEGESTQEAMLRELKEEAGIVIDPEEDLAFVWEHLDVPVCKSTDMRASLYILGIEDYYQVTPAGDGTLYESQSRSVHKLMDENLYNEIENQGDFLLLSMMNFAMRALEHYASMMEEEEDNGE